MFVATRYATNKRSSSNVERISTLLGRDFLVVYGENKMHKGRFYFLSEQYYIDFNDSFLMKNKESINGILHNRPCFYSLQDKKTGIYWFIPISSQVKKFKKIYNCKIKKLGVCDTLDFGNVLGHEKAFLIQNMCPVTTEYISNEYIDNVNNTPVKLDKAFESKLVIKANKVLALQRKGVNLIFPDVLYIEKKLIEKSSPYLLQNSR